MANWKGNEATKQSGRSRINDKRSSMYIPVPEGYYRHHIDGNPLNNAPENIEVLLIADHNRLHIAKTCPHGIYPKWSCKQCIRDYQREWMRKYRLRKKSQS